MKFVWAIVCVFVILTVQNNAVKLDQVAMFGLGFASGTVFHELGHAAVTKLSGFEITSFKFRSVGVFAPKSDPNLRSKMRNVTMGGYAFQTLASEIIYRNNKWHHNDYALGWMSLGLFVNLSNPIRFYLLGQKNNDLGKYESFGGNPLWPSLIMMTYSIFTLQRIMNRTDIPFHISNNTLGFNFKF